MPQRPISPETPANIAGGQLWGAAAGEGPLRIVHVIDGLGAGGAERLLAAYAPRLGAIGHEVHVVTLKEVDGNPMQARLEEAGIAVHLVRVSKLRRLDQASRVIRKLRDLSPDVVHTHLEFSGIIAIVGRVWHRAPIVATLHTLETPVRFTRGDARIWLTFKLLERFATRVICLTPSAAEQARRHGLARARIAVLANGIELERFGNEPDVPRRAIRTSMGVAQAAPLILAVAVLRPQKGIDRLIEAMPDILREHPEARLLVVGDGPELPRLKDRTEALGLDAVIRFAGMRDDIPEIMSAADVFVLPTLIDAQPTVVMEAMASRLPVIASQTGGLPDMIDNNVDGILVPPGDPAALAAAVSGLLADPERHAALACAGRKRAEVDFSIDSQVARLATLYHDVVSGWV